jgi:hypothetical protein
MDKSLLQIAMTSDFKKSLKAYAAEAGLSMTEVVHLALLVYFEQEMNRRGLNA